jgi:hypothetical protein
MQINIPDEDIRDTLEKISTNHHSKSKERMIWPVQEVLERKAD